MQSTLFISQTDYYSRLSYRSRLVLLVRKAYKRWETSCYDAAAAFSAIDPDEDAIRAACQIRNERLRRLNKLVSFLADETNLTKQSVHTEIAQWTGICPRLMVNI